MRWLADLNCWPGVVLTRSTVGQGCYVECVSVARDVMLDLILARGSMLLAIFPVFLKAL